MMAEILNPLLQWLNANPNWAAFAVFLISTGESVAILGTIVPGTVIMTAIGALVGAGVIPLWPTIIAAILGAVVGDGISYLIGHHFKDRIRLIWPFRNNPEWLNKGEQFFHKHGGKSVFIGRFVGPVRAIVPVIAGMLGMKPVRFYVANITSAIGWAPAYLLPGIVLGAASLELPPDIAAHVILMLLLVTLFIIFCVWIIVKILMLVQYKIEQALTEFWNRLKHSRYAHSITVVLKHHNPNKTHGQLVLAFYFTCIVIVMSCLTYTITSYGSNTLFINNAVLHFCRSLRTPTTDTIMVYITLLGEKRVLIPLIAIVFGWLLLTKRYYLAWHVFALGILTIGSIEIIKHAAHSIRPWGIQHSPESYSFPSGHTTLATTFYIGFALLLSKAYPSKRRYFIISALILVLMVSLSRLYLNAHWFTDVLAGWLLSAALLMLITISYHRKKYDIPSLKSLFWVTSIAFILLYASMYIHSFDRLKQNYNQKDYPSASISLNAWWKKTDNAVPVYRINRFGITTQILNIQWLGNLNDIKTTLLHNNWEIPPERDWISIIQRITDVQSTESLPLVSPLYLDKKPVLVLIKHTDNKQVMVLRLWASNVTILPDHQLWVGTISMIPRTYNWLFRKKSDEICINSKLLFEKSSQQFDAHEIVLSRPYNHRKYKTTPTILLIKPKSLTIH
jgi:membrane protein DedA with SNARE-associated domain/membrane-associated phospholipid phosphatase